jgi:hypothetical protein
MSQAHSIPPYTNRNCAGDPAKNLWGFKKKQIPMQSGRSTTQKRLLSQRSYKASSFPSPDGSGALNVQGRAKSIASQLRRSAENIPALPFPSRSHATSPMMTATDDTPRSSQPVGQPGLAVGGHGVIRGRESCHRIRGQRRRVHRRA